MGLVFLSDTHIITIILSYNPAKCSAWFVFPGNGEWWDTSRCSYVSLALDFFSQQLVALHCSLVFDEYIDENKSALELMILQIMD